MYHVTTYACPSAHFWQHFYWAHKTDKPNVPLHVIIMSRTRFIVNIHSIVAWMSWNSLLKTDTISDVLNDNNGIQIHSHLVRKRTLNHLAKLASLAKWFSVCLRTNFLTPLMTFCLVDHKHMIMHYYWTPGSPWYVLIF